MATLSNPIFYKGGVEGGSQLVGFNKATSDESFSNYVVRYTLTIDPTESGDHIYAYIATKGYLEWNSEDTQYKVNDEASLYFKIGTDPTEFANAGYAQRLDATGKVNMVSTYDLNYDVELEADVMLLPGHTYYVWIFPGFAASGEPNGNYTVGHFGWYGIYNHAYTIELSGNAGLIHIGTGTEVLSALLFIDTGDEIEQTMPLLDTGSEILICS